MNNEELSIETRASKSGINADQVLKVKYLLLYIAIASLPKSFPIV